MSSRFLLILIFAAVLLVTSALLILYYQNPLAAASFVIAAIVGAVFARLTFFSKTFDAPTKSATLDEIETPTIKKELPDVPASALLEATMESMREGVLVIDGAMRIVAANRAAHDIFGAVEERQEPRRLSDLTRHPPVYAAFQTALEAGERSETKVEIHISTSGTGERRVFDLRVAPLMPIAPRGKRGAIGVFFDITRLERLERVRQEFLSNVSHELRTPLTAILTFVETLEEGAVDDGENNRRFLSVIRRNAARMHNLIDDILELSAIEAGMVSVEPACVRLQSLTSDCFTALAPRAAERRIELRNEVDANVYVYADARRLEQMLTNLVDNAIKFNCEQGTVTIRHESTETRDQIIITDTGEGIAPEHLPRIFERFYRIDRARSRALGGTGLGLAIVKHLARAHNGETTVRSAPGEGSTFTIELPKKRQLRSDGE